MGYRIKNLAPDNFLGIKIDKESLEKDVSKSEYEELVDPEGNLDSAKLLEKYGLTYVLDVIWIRVFEGTTVKLEITAHKILKSFLYTPDQFEGVNAIVFSNYLGLFAEVAGGQGGGFAFIDIDNGKWIFSTREFSVQDILWLPNYSIFICCRDVYTYTWHTISIALIKTTGEIALFNLTTHDYFENKKLNDFSDHMFIQKVEDKDYNNNNEFTIKYTSEEDKLHFYFDGHWQCSFQDLLDNSIFKVI